MRIPPSRISELGRIQIPRHQHVGQVITWHPADALEQSESSSHSRKTQRQTSSHPARHSLAYVLPRHNPPRKQGHPHP
ncbi:DUF1589 domain-containing protein [Rhodopirellula europaea]|uniref:DUF1589 domain-containing protein n=1 Tax=Rhodopirellula europaea TaxID=1263866 RepID=UPI003C6DCE8F